MTNARTTTQEQRATLAAKIERDIRKKAKRHVYARVGLVWHLAVFVIVNVALVAINLNYTPDTHWFVWPLAGWGVGLFLHFMATFMTTGKTSDMVEKEIEREKRRRGLVE